MQSYVLAKPHSPYQVVNENKEFSFSLLHGSNDSFLLSFSTMMSYSKLPSAGELIQQYVDQRYAALDFNNSWIVDLNEIRVHELLCQRVTPLVTAPVRLVLSTARLYLQPLDNVASEPVIRYVLANVCKILKRRFALRQVGLELLFEGDQSLYLCFSSQEERNLFYQAISDVCSLDAVKDDLLETARKWQYGLLSNFDYLTYLNHMADRTTSDLTQYPVFPWVITDYTSDQLDLNDASIYRDLSKPVGALNPQRLAMYRTRYAQMPTDDPEHPRFLYGTHYSTPGYVLFYLVRKCPQLMLRLQNGKFDDPDRCFDSIPAAWDSCFCAPADVKELIPEFFSDPSFLVNAKHLDLGVKQSGGSIGDVALPKWAQDSPQRFTEIQREALESEHVSQNLHHWIDLIFGYKQKGEEAVKADNLFYHLTYEGAVNLESEKDPARRRAMELQIREFGQTPSQLFTRAHVQRVPRDQWTGEVPVVQQTSAFEQQAAPMLEELQESSMPDVITEDLGSIVVKLDPSPRAVANTGGPWDPQRLIDAEVRHSVKIHRDCVNGILATSDAQSFYSVSSDCTLRHYHLGEQKQKRNQSISGLALSACAWIPHTEEKKMFISSYDNRVYLYSLEFAHSTDNLFAHDDAISCMRLQGNMLITGSWDTLVRLWDVEQAGRINADPLVTFHDVNTEVRSVALSADLRVCVAGGDDGTLIFGDVRSGEVIRMEQPHQHHSVEACSLATSADGSNCVSAGADGRLVRTHTNGHQSVVGEAASALRSLQCDGRVALAGTEDGLVRVYDVRERRALGQLNAVRCKAPVSAIVLRGDLIYVGSQEGRVVVAQI